MRHLRTLLFGLWLLFAVQPASAAAPSSGAIDEGQFVTVGGIEQWITVRGSDRRNPVMLILHGGPGFPMSFLAPLYADWEKDFTIVQWDQPATGATYLRNKGKPSGPLTIARYVHDGIEVSLWARAHLGAKKIVLLGTSWGSVLGVEMIHQRPDLFSAYVGAAQAVGTRGALVGYRMALQAALDRGDAAAIADLTRVGPPPYSRFEDFMVRQVHSNPPGLPATPAQAAMGKELMSIFTHPDPQARYNAPVTIPPGFDGGLMEAQHATWKETWSWESAHLGNRFEVPVFIFQGDADVNTPTSVTREWFDGIRAPAKAFAVIPGAGHDVVLFHAQLLPLLERYVLPVARGR